MQINNKEYIVKFYTPSGTFLDSVGAFRWDGITKQINVGLGQFNFTLLNKFDDFKEGYTIKLNNRVELVVIDRDTGSDGLVVYSGWISSYAPEIRGSKEKVSVSCFGYLSKLATSLARIGSQVSSLVTDGTGISALPAGTAAVATATENVFKAAIDKYRAAAVNPVINYATGTIQATGTTMSYTFNETYFAEMLKACLKSAPTRWYYYAGADNVIYFGPAPSTPTHTFTFQKDFENISIIINGDSIVNNVLFESSNDYVKILRKVGDTESEGLMDDRWTIIKDNSVASTGTADNIANSFLNSNKDPKRKIQVDIIDNNTQDPNKRTQTGYDIERIQPGDTCSFANFSALTSLAFGTNNLLIVAVSYTPGKATLTLEEIQENVARDAAQAKRDAQIATGYSGLTTFGTSNSNPTGKWESGDIKETAGAVANPGWLWADGGVYLRSDYPDLFTTIGTAYNTGGESGLQFRVPDKRGRVAIGGGGGWTRGSYGGEQNHTLSTGEMPWHDHPFRAWLGNSTTVLQVNDHTGDLPLGTDNAGGNGEVYEYGGGIGDDRAVKGRGGSGGHNNMQPYVVCNFLIKT